MAMTSHSACKVTNTVPHKQAQHTNAPKLIVYYDDTICRQLQCPHLQLHKAMGAWLWQGRRIQQIMQLI